ncbi:hypothetical protein MMPV_002964 [Pyropia vietnamensis]
MGIAAVVAAVGVAASVVAAAGAHEPDGHTNAPAAAVAVDAAANMTIANATTISGTYKLATFFEPSLGVSPSEPCHDKTTLVATASSSSGVLVVPYSQLAEDGRRCSGNGRIVLFGGAGVLNGSTKGETAGVEPPLTQAQSDALAQLQGNAVALAAAEDLPDEAVRVGLYTEDARVCQTGGTSQTLSGITLVVAYTHPVARRRGVAGRTLLLPSGTVWMTFTPAGDAGLLTQPVCIYQRTGDPELPPFSSGGGDDVCFPADATVQRRDGARVPLSAVSIGDELRVAAGAGDASWSRVYMFSHRVMAGARPFVELTTASGAALTATSSHLVYASGALVPAGSVAIGDALEVVDAATGEAVSSPVVATRMVGRTGLVNPHTLHGDIIVDGVRASTWTTTVDPAVASALLAPARAVWRLGGVDLSKGVLEGGDGEDRIRRLARLLPRWKATA